MRVLISEAQIKKNQNETKLKAKTTHNLILNIGGGNNPTKKVRNIHIF